MNRQTILARQEYFSPDSHKSLVDRPLRIALIAPLYESVPPKLYGGTERVVAYIAEELARRGHEVTLFASGDSTAKVPLRAGFPKALRLTGLDYMGPAYHLPMLSEIYEHAERFDIIHSHVDFLAFPFSRLVSVPTVSTMHGRLDLDAFLPLYRSYTDLPLVSISDEQRRPLLFMNWIATVYHGLPKDLLRFNPGAGTYLAFLGRIAPEKRPDLAIEIARRSGMPLKIAAKVDRVDRDYFEAVIKPLLSTPRVEFLGEINDSEKQDFLGGALALLFTVDWPEPFGLAMIEAMASGLPVISTELGTGTSYVNEDGVTGLIVPANDPDALASGIGRLLADPGLRGRMGAAGRIRVRENFTTEAMMRGMDRLYAEALERAGSRVPTAVSDPSGRPRNGGQGLP